ncbi:hypothetical protein PCC7424_5626 (plasmid) [Gloeothece citriformis PCC 7424]|uniref:Uncharacterized protein n=1 Tax=Gloeothece citriformis (strain PCC 7424) TaxID=65393 RepID=B7KLN0_GLOC7|nr:hypothetical protein PCC7424_5626 [Gloeothece citriformis PCC 7424]
MKAPKMTTKMNTNLTSLSIKIFRVSLSISEYLGAKLFDKDNSLSAFVRLITRIRVKIKTLTVYCFQALTNSRGDTTVLDLTTKMVKPLLHKNSVDSKELLSLPPETYIYQGLQRLYPIATRLSLSISISRPCLYCILIFKRSRD